MSELPAFTDPRKLLSRYGLVPKRSYSQNFLVARPTVEAIAKAAAEGAPPLVVELGAGLGTLTVELMRRSGQVLAIERDRQMLHVLEQELGPHGLELLAHDAAELDYRALAERAGGPVHVAGNLPYAATGAILRRLIEHRAAIARAVLMLQREVRDRLIAAPGSREYGALSVFCQVAFAIDTVLHVPPGAFVPRPKVSSSVIRLSPRPRPLTEESAAFRAVVRAAFQQRRKTLRNALRALGDDARARGALAHAALDGSRRGETLSIAEFAALARAWERAA